MKKSLRLSLILTLISFSLFAALDVFDNISSAIRTGDARQLSRFFNTNVDLTILNQEEVYSKAQAEQIVKDFFSKNTPKSFTIIHNGLSKEGSKYAIGNLVTVQGSNYRTYLYIKQSGGAEYIQELRFEKE
ncbi:MAG TPA: DUF4783 domain-containing protein [Bacteroidia bacterium]|nr:DUF4783 domain-containing protein [Bacteroidia bacterium]